MKHTKHILFLSYDGLTDPLGQSQIIPYLKGLCRYGYRFTILSCDKPALYKANKKAVEEQLTGAAIEWVSIPYHKSPPVLSSAYDYWQMKRMAYRLHRKYRFDMVHTRPGVPTVVALGMKKKFGIQFLNDVRGFWAQERVDGGMWNLKNIVYKQLYRFFRKHELQCLLQADGLVCLTEAARRIIMDETAVHHKTTDPVVIPCSADTVLFDPASVNTGAQEALKQQWGIKEDELVISYLGSIGGWYLIDEMMQFCHEVHASIPQARFLFISPHRHEQIVQAAQKYGIPSNRLITVRAERNLVPLYLSLSHYNLFFIRPCYSKLASSPTKHGEVMAMGIPVITNSGVGDMDDIILRTQSGWLVETFSRESYADVVRRLQSQVPFNATAIRKSALEIYGLEHAVQKYSEVYRNMLGD